VDNHRKTEKIRPLKTMTYKKQLSKSRKWVKKQKDKNLIEKIVTGNFDWKP